MNTTIGDLVTQFYQRLWNAWDDDAVEDVLSEGFTFRGTLGDETVGRDGWRRYRDTIRRAAPDFTNTVVELLVDGERAAARLRYTGTHQGPLLGLAGTGRTFGYSGAAFFTSSAGQLVEAWVLGDLDGLRRQLGPAGDGTAD
jgi:steroid delta-isomerase-like uncharacterized protein